MMAQKLEQVDLREPGFLLWLGQFVGEWKLQEFEVEVRRRDDGFIEANSLPGYEQVPLGLVLEKGKFVKPAESPLGPYPVGLSDRLLHHWLPAEEAARFHGAWHVGIGRRQMLEAIERRIAEMPQSEREARWLEWWAAGAISFPTIPRNRLTSAPADSGCAARAQARFARNARSLRRSLASPAAAGEPYRSGDEKGDPQ
jgi:hypothetical protein